MSENLVKTAGDLEIEKDIAKLREIIKRRRSEEEMDDINDKCETRWVMVDEKYLEYYGFKKLKYCNIHYVNKTLYVIHQPSCKTSVKCHCCGQLCVPQFLCIPCSGEINKSRKRTKNYSS